MNVANKKKDYIIFFFLLILIFYLFIFSNNGYLKIRKLNIEIKNLEGRINNLKTSNLKLKEEIYNLKYNDDYIEKIARQELKMIKPGEKVCKIIKRRSEK